MAGARHRYLMLLGDLSALDTSGGDHGAADLDSDDRTHDRGH